MKTQPHSFLRLSGVHTFHLLFTFASLVTRDFYYSKGDENKCISIALFGPKKLHGVSPSGGLVSPSGGIALLLFDQVGYFASIKLCQALSRQGAIIKIPVVRCHYL